MIRLVPKPRQVRPYRLRVREAPVRGIMRRPIPLILVMQDERWRRNRGKRTCNVSYTWCVDPRDQRAVRLRTVPIVLGVTESVARLVKCGVCPFIEQHLTIELSRSLEINLRIPPVGHGVR